MSEQKGRVDFTIAPEEPPEDAARQQAPATPSTPVCCVPPGWPWTRLYSNFCAIQHTPFDFTLTFCEVLPPTERQLREAQTTHVVRAPVRARIAVPFQMVPGLIAALQDNFRLYQESLNPPRGPAN